MSRIGRLPVDVPSGVQVNVQGSDIHVKGPKGELKRTFSSLVDIAMEDGQVVITRKSDHQLNVQCMVQPAPLLQI